MIVVTSVIFLLPFGLIIFNVKNQYCLGSNPKTENPLTKGLVDFNVTQNTFKNYVAIKNRGYDYCPVPEKIFKIYDFLGEPSFCAEKIPNFYPWIQARYWNVIFMSFVQLGKYEELIFVLISLPVSLYYIYFASTNLFKEFIKSIGTPIDYDKYILELNSNT